MSKPAIANPSLGRTGCQPVPSGDSPDGTGKAFANNSTRLCVSGATLIPVGESPVPPTSGPALKRSRKFFGVALAALAAVFLLSALKLPLWHLRMEAPQYRDEEALKVNVFAGSMKGDLREITVLNQYIGVHIPEVLPQSKWLPTALIIGAALGLVASLLPLAVRRGALLVAGIALAGAIGIAVFQARQQMHDIGHKRDAHTKLARVRDFDPPFLGTAKVAQFTVSSWLGSGAYLLGAAIALQLGGAFVSRRGCEANCRSTRRETIPTTESDEALA